MGHTRWALDSPFWIFSLYRIFIEKVFSPFSPLFKVK